MKKQALKTKTERLFPVGFEWQTELSMFAAALTWSSLWGIIGFYNRLSVAFDHIENGGDMLQFYEVLGNAIFWFPIAAAFMLVSIALHYAHHQSGSKSIYLMRRLPDRWELHRRCLTVPIAAVIVCAAIAAALFFIFYWSYMLLTPEELLRPGQLELVLKYWSVM